MLIDTGLHGSHPRIFKEITGLGLQPSDLRWIVITHADGDHTGSISEIRGASQARTYADPEEASAIRQGKSSRELRGNSLVKLFFTGMTHLFQAAPAVIDETIESGFELPVLGGLEVIRTPGHTPGHISLYSRTTRILFAGDSIQVARHRLMPSTGMNNWDEEQSLRSYQVQASLHPKIVCAGHGWTDHQVEEKVSKFLQLH
jgi:glyoxylase-like metal-dependent hydrolase (beta-lactamase superfamily II)